MPDLPLPFTNAQEEILKLFTTNLNKEELYELKNLLANFYGKKAIEKADEIWDAQALSEEDMNRWLHQKS